MVHVSEKLSAAVTKDGRKKMEIAAAAGISAVVLSKYLNLKGGVQPKVDTLTKLARALGLPLSYFYQDGAGDDRVGGDENKWKARALRAGAKLKHLQRACNALGQHVSTLGMTVDDFSKIISE